jgi:hypothetical protein
VSDLLDAIGALDPDGPRDPWDRWPGEPETAYAAFVGYRDLGRARTVKLASERQKLGAPYLYNLSSKWGWVARARKWDDEQDRAYAAEMLDARVAMGRQHMSVANVLLAKGVEALRNLDPSRLGARELREYITEAIRLQRLIAGEATERVESSEAAPVAAVTPDEARSELEAVQAEIDRRLRGGVAAAPAE